MDSAAAQMAADAKAPRMSDDIYLAAIAIGVTWIPTTLASVFFGVMVASIPGLIGYALGIYLAPLAGHLARMAVGQ